MASALVSYDTSDSDDSDSDTSLPSGTLLSSALVPRVDMTPAVTHKAELLTAPEQAPIDPMAKEVAFNPRADQLFAPVVGPELPHEPNRQIRTKNHMTGFVEPSHINDFNFETQRRTYESYGYAVDPSVDRATSSSSGPTSWSQAKSGLPAPGDASLAEPLIGDLGKAAESGSLTVFESIAERPGDKRKRQQNKDAADIEGYLGPWGKYVDEKTVATPSEEDKPFLDEYLAKMAARKKGNRRKQEDTPMEEKSQLHLPSDKDYQGRSFLHAPHDVDVNLRSEDPPHKCFLPKRLLHEWSGAHGKGISCVRLFPNTGHMALTAGMDHKVKLWELYKERRLVRSYLGHRQAVKDAAFDNEGASFLTSSYDRFVKLWDTETGQCKERFALKRIAYCVRFNPDKDKQHLFVAGCADKKIVCYDTRSGEVTQEYDRHLGAVNTITFVDGNRRFVSTSDDKSVRVWEWDIPVDFKYIADPTMHSMPAVVLSPNGKWLCCQSLDNQIVVFNVLRGMKRMRKKVYRGHMVAGYACGMDFSPDMGYLVSGDGDGKVYAWDWKTRRILSRWKAHDAPCISLAWLPHETSKLITAGWDGSLKLWD